MSDLNIKIHSERLLGWTKWRGPVSFCFSLQNRNANSGNNVKRNKRKILKGGKEEENWFDIIDLEEQQGGMASCILSSSRKIICLNPRLAKGIPRETRASFGLESLGKVLQALCHFTGSTFLLYST